MTVGYARGMTTQMATEVVPAPADDLCLQFVDTCYWRGRATPTDGLRQADDLLDWIARSRAVPDAAVRRARDEWSLVPSCAVAAFDAAIALRETLHRIFATISAQGAVATSDIAALNAALAETPTRRHLINDDALRGWQVSPLASAATALLTPVLWSAADLLAGARLTRVHQCANPECGWLFLDSSKSGNRRWCDMGACGNREKARRHYLRHKATDPSEP